MAKRIAVFGLSANPPGLHHREIVSMLVRKFDLVIVVPCGPRPDKETVDDIAPLHRAVMADMTFSNLPKVVVDLDDLEREIFTRTFALWKKYSSEGEVWIAVGSDLVPGGKRGQSLIQKEWRKGPKLWRQANFVVIMRKGFECLEEDLPPNRKVVLPSVGGASTLIRQKVFNHENFRALVMPEVASYIEKRGLYRGMRPRVTSEHVKINPRVLLLVDDKNPRSKLLAQRFSHLSGPKPNCIVVVGGDGFMLRAIRKYWRRRLPFIGINAGHWGFLMNSLKGIRRVEKIFDDLSLIQSPILYVESSGLNGKTKTGLAFNDTWTRSINGGQAARTEVWVNGELLIPNLVSDGALVATPAGSTSYARAMGAKPLPVGSTQLVLVGSNVFEPIGWGPVYLSGEDTVLLKTLEGAKRPVEAYVDGISIGATNQLSVRISRIAAAELGFLSPIDLKRKILRLQFPLK